MNYPLSIARCHVPFCGMLLFVFALGILSCQRTYTPKPDGYFRIDPYPEKYRRVSMQESSSALSFEIPEQAQTVLVNDIQSGGVRWLNVCFPRYRATLHCSYHPLRGNFEQLNGESKELVYRQSIHPDRVQAIAYADTLQAVYATFYDLTAESATPLQFVVTDSTRYLLRGVLYFDEPGRSDSIAPVIDDLTHHIFHLIESIKNPTR